LALLPRQLRPFWWYRCTLPAWLRLLAGQRYAIDRDLWPRALATTASCAAVSVLGLVQSTVFGAAVRRTTISEPPLFVLGHWRSGTTYLHDLLSLDSRFTFPTRYDCAAPDHFLLTGRLARFWTGTEVKGHRPMDNVGVGLDTPAEDEVGLCVLGVPSPYLDPAFPNRPPIYQDYLDLERVAPQARTAWKKALLCFMQAITYQRPGRLLLKSPTHTARIKVLLEMFPRACFLHIVRNPYVIFPSMQRTLQAMWSVTSLQRPPFPRLRESILAGYPKLMDRLEADRGLVDPARFHELRYEDLARDPVGQLRGIYDHFGIDGFDRVRERLDRYLAKLGTYETTRHQPLSPELHAELTRRWGRYIEKYGYGEANGPGG